MCIVRLLILHDFGCKWCSIDYHVPTNASSSKMTVNLNLTSTWLCVFRSKGYDLKTWAEEPRIEMTWFGWTVEPERCKLCSLITSTTLPAGDEHTLFFLCWNCPLNFLSSTQFLQGQQLLPAWGIPPEAAEFLFLTIAFLFPSQEVV